MKQLLATSPCIFSSTTIIHCSTNLFSPWPTTWRNLGRSRVLLRRFTIVSQLSSVETNQRRSANYHPSIWEPQLIESLTTPYSYEVHGPKLETLKKEARNLLKYAQDPCSILGLVDLLQRLGVAYHFGKEIDEALHNVVSRKTDIQDLYTTCLLFRILREHAIPISTDVFDKFRGTDGKFMDSLVSDAVALLSLYEASHLGLHGEGVMEEAKKFSEEHLKSCLVKLDCNIAIQMQQSLNVPLRRRLPRIEAMNFIHVYQKYDTKNFTLLELAKLDYNLVQAVYQQELKELSTWWRNLGLKEKMNFSRDRLMENYIWVKSVRYTGRIYKNGWIKWKKLCESYLTEATWFYKGHTPSLQEYLENAWNSIGGPEAIVHAYILQAGFDEINSADHCFKHSRELIYWSSLITRLNNDLGTSKAESDRGDVLKSKELYMIEAGTSREEATKHVKCLMDESWKKLNEESCKSPAPRSMINMCLNMARTSQCLFQHGDGIGTSNGYTKDLLPSLIVRTIN